MVDAKKNSIWTATVMLGPDTAAGKPEIFDRHCRCTRGMGHDIAKGRPKMNGAHIRMAGKYRLD